MIRDFPGDLKVKNPPCNAGDVGSIPGWEDPLEKEGIGYPLRYSWASCVVQLVKNLPTVLETWVGKISTLEKGKATHSSILA